MRKLAWLIYIAFIILVVFFVVNPIHNSNNDENKEVVFYSGGSIDPENLKYKDKLLRTYEDYQEITSFYEIEEKIKKNDFESYDYLTVVYENDYCKSNLVGVEELDVKDNLITVTIGIISDEEICPVNYEMLFVRVDKNQIKDGFKTKLEYAKVKE